MYTNYKPESVTSPQHCEVTDSGIKITAISPNMQKKLINIILIPIVLGYIIFEEIVWDRFAEPIFRYINQLKILQKLDQLLQRINSKVILIIFVLLFVTVELLGGVAAGLFIKGKVITSVLVYATKIPISALTFWIFQATRKRLMKFVWFKQAYLFLMNIISVITHSQVYLGIKAKTAPIKKYIRENLVGNKGYLKGRIQAIYAKLKAIVNREI
jgi:hypothetical protein